MMIRYEPRVLYPRISNNNLALWCQLQAAGWTIDWHSPYASELLHASGAIKDVISLRRGIIEWEDITNMIATDRGKAWSFKATNDTYPAYNRLQNVYYHKFIVSGTKGKTRTYYGIALKRAISLRLPR